MTALLATIAKMDATTFILGPPKRRKDPVDTYLECQQIRQKQRSEVR